MVQGHDWLESIAKGMKDAKTNGAAPSPVWLTARELVQRFGGQRRGDWINSQIRNALEKYDLSMDPDLAVGWIDSTITLRLDSEVHAVADAGATPDPTHRIGSLEAAKKKPIDVKPDNPLNTATTIMQKHDFSQLPVMTNERNVLGIISWQTIGVRRTHGQECDLVRQCMDPAEELPSTAPVLEAIDPIAKHGYVLVRGGDRKITGIVTASDIALHFRQLAGPFLNVGEIEGYLRHLIRGKFTLDQLRVASGSEDGRPIEGSADLTLGGYCRLLQKEDNWNKLCLNIDRVEFGNFLDTAREIRNNVMHFNPAGLSEDDMKQLRDIARFFRNLVRMGAM